MHPGPTAFRATVFHQGTARRACALSLVVLGGVVGLGLSGRVCGGRDLRHQVSTDDVDLFVELPATLRSRTVFDARVHLLARCRIGQLVFAAERGLWRELTTISMLPTAEQEDHEKGLLRFNYVTLAAGDVLDLQFAQQVNPALYGRNRGRMIACDEQRALAELALVLEVWP